MKFQVGSSRFRITEYFLHFFFNIKSGNMYIPHRIYTQIYIYICIVCRIFSEFIVHRVMVMLPNYCLDFSFVLGFNKVFFV